MVRIRSGGTVMRPKGDITRAAAGTNISQAQKYTVAVTAIKLAQREGAEAAVLLVCAAPYVFMQIIMKRLTVRRQEC